MGMKQTIEVLNAMVADGVIGRYAIAGAVAAFYYIEVSSTDDLDILVSFEDHDVRSRSGLVLLTPIVTYLAQRGYTDFLKEGLVIEGWPVQFLPVASDLDLEALQAAAEVEIAMGPRDDPVLTHVLKPEHLVANALQLKRPKDRLRILQFLGEGKVDLIALRQVLDRHLLLDRWSLFCREAGIENTIANKDHAP